MSKSLSEYEYPNASIMVDAKEFVVRTAKYTPKELGEILLNIYDDTLSGRWENLEDIEWIVRYYKGTSPRDSIPPSLRKKVKSALCCTVCGSDDRTEIDHIIPVSKGGDSSEENLQLLCFTCNRSKSDQNFNEWLKEEGYINE